MSSALQQQLEAALLVKRGLVKRRARGFLKHDYVVPGGPYEEQWDWDGFFVAMSLATQIPSEAVYLRNWCLNYLEHVRTDGFTPGLLTPRGVDRRLSHVKPFLAQGCAFTSRFLNDVTWLRPHWRRLQASVAYRERRHEDRVRGLACWHNSMESGADNTPAVVGYPIGSVAGADLNTYLVREHLALAELARRLGKSAATQRSANRAAALTAAMRRWLWDPVDQRYYNLDRRTGQRIRRVTWVSLMPLWGGIATPAQARAFIRGTLLDSRQLWARFGIRTLSLNDPDYNQANIIKPHSNWQGPVWPLVNYFAMHALVRYGFRTQAQQLAERTARLCLADLHCSGGMHENYHAESGRPLAAPNFISWNLLVGGMLEQARSGDDPFHL